MSLPVRLLPEAKAEFDDSADWYERQQAGLGVDFIARIRSVIDRIAASPQMHAVVYKQARKAVVTRFPFVVIYHELPTELLVISVFHSSRDPSVWQSRV
jgi:toxin ParE1/3/4